MTFSTTSLAKLQNVNQLDKKTWQSYIARNTVQTFKQQGHQGPNKTPSTVESLSLKHRFCTAPLECRSPADRVARVRALETVHIYGDTQPQARAFWTHFLQLPCGWGDGDECGDPATLLIRSADVCCCCCDCVTCAARVLRGSSHVVVLVMWLQQQ